MVGEFDTSKLMAIMHTGQIGVAAKIYYIIAIWRHETGPSPSGRPWMKSCMPPWVIPGFFSLFSPPELPNRTLTIVLYVCTTSVWFYMLHYCVQNYNASLSTTPNLVFEKKKPLGHDHFSRFIHTDSLSLYIYPCLSHFSFWQPVVFACS